MLFLGTVPFYCYQILDRFHIFILSWFLFFFRSCVGMHAWFVLMRIGLQFNQRISGYVSTSSRKRHRSEDVLMWNWWQMAHRYLTTVPWLCVTLLVLLVASSLWSTCILTWHVLTRWFGAWRCATSCIQPPIYLNNGPFFSAAELLTLKELKSYQLEACVARIVFPVLGWGVNYQFGMFFSDVMSSIEPWLASSSLHGWGDQNCWSTFFTAESRISRVICQVLQELNLEQASQLLWSIPTPVLEKKIQHVNVYNSLIAVYYQLSPRFQYQRQPLKEWFAEALLLKDTVVLWFNLTGYNQFSPSEDLVGRRIGGLGWL